MSRRPAGLFHGWFSCLCHAWQGAPVHAAVAAGEKAEAALKPPSHENSHALLHYPAACIRHLVVEIDQQKRATSKTALPAVRSAHREQGHFGRWRIHPYRTTAQNTGVRASHYSTNSNLSGVTSSTPFFAVEMWCAGTAPFGCLLVEIVSAAAAHGQPKYDHNSTALDQTSPSG